MPKLPCVSGEEAVKALGKLGFVFLRQKGSHAILRRGSQGCVVPMHREISQGTLRAFSNRPASANRNSATHSERGSNPVSGLKAREMTAQPWVKGRNEIQPCKGGTIPDDGS